MATRKQQPLEHRLLLTATFCLLAGGAVMVYSASSARTLLEGEGDGTAYLVKYLIYGARRACSRCTCSRATGSTRPADDAAAAGRRVRPAGAGPAAGIRRQVNGARRWLGAGPLQFQPSEMMKLALVLHTAAVLSARPQDRGESAHRSPARSLGVAGTAVLLIVAPARPRHGARDRRHGRGDAGRRRTCRCATSACVAAVGAPARPALRAARALPARAAHRVPRTRGRTPAGRASRPCRARSRSARAGCSASASASRSRRSSTCPRPTPTSSSP